MYANLCRVVQDPEKPDFQFCFDYRIEVLGVDLAKIKYVYIRNDSTSSDSLQRFVTTTVSTWIQAMLRPRVTLPKVWVVMRMLRLTLPKARMVMQLHPG